MSEIRLIDANALLTHQVEADRMGAMLVVWKGHILNATTIDAIEVSEIEPRINDALALLDELNGEGRVEYDAYRRLHDAIGIIGMRKEAADGRSD